MGEMIEFARPDGKSCPGFLALPSAGADSPGIVVIQEWWGLNEQIKNMAERFAEAGFRALVPDLFRGKITKDAGEANHMMEGLNFMDAAEQDLRGGVQHMKKYATTKIAVGGFCMGGALTILCAQKIPEMDAGACFYGVPPKAALDPSAIRVPLILHFASMDDWCTPAVVDDLEQSLRAANIAHELHRYEAQHAFMNEHRPEVYAAGAAALAWQRTIEFLRRTLS